jgi:aspartate/methionine/tyrosine aminotransferase
MMKNLPISQEIIKKCKEKCNLKSIGNASIREIRQLVNLIEQEVDLRFIRMEMGIPGLPTPQVAINAEIDALKRGVASLYPDIDGIPVLKKEISRFVKLFIGVDVDERGCVPTIGSMNASYASLSVAGKVHKSKDTILFLDPGFPIHKQLVKMLGLKSTSLDVYNYRGEKLKDKLEEMLSKHNISSILYSNPNNPSWICFTEKELKIIGDFANKNDLIILEDLAYFGMDFRKDLSHPGKAPFQSTVANYTKNYILMISSSKSFSYAGQRVGMMAISNELYNRKFPDLEIFFPNAQFGHAIVHGAIYGTTAGTSHSAQYGLAALLKAVNDGEYNFLNDVREYGRRAEKLKPIFLKNGFKLVYDRDEDKELADGFYFTISYPDFSGEELIDELINYGISAISLSATGSTRKEGIRACVSLISNDDIESLESRLHKFNTDQNKKMVSTKNLDHQKRSGSLSPSL